MQSPAWIPSPVCHLISWHSSYSSLSAYHTNTLLSFSLIQGLWICYPFPWNILQLLIPQVPSLRLNAISSNTLTIIAKESHATACIIFYNNTFLNFYLSIWAFTVKLLDNKFHESHNHICFTQYYTMADT